MMQHATVLIASSCEKTAEFFCRSLCELHTLCFVYDSAKEALQILKSQAVVVVIADEMLSDMSGWNFLEQVAKIAPQTVRIFYGSTCSDFAKIIASGKACHCLKKPIDQSSLTEAIKSLLNPFCKPEEKQDLKGLIIKQHQRLSLTHEMLQEELKLGAQVHEVLLKGEVPHDPFGMEIATFSSASRDIDGDFFDFYRPSPYCQDLVVGDVMGKGLPAALVGTAMKIQLTRYSNASSLSATSHQTGIWQPTLLSPAAIMENVQVAMAQPLIDLSYFVSLFYGRIDVERRRFTYIDCGAPKPFLLRSGSSEPEELSGCNFPMGMIAKDCYEERGVEIGEGDLFLFFSDGVTETRAPDGELFGNARLKKLFCDLRKKPPQEITDGIIAHLHTYSKRNLFDDDVTLIVLKATLEVPELPENQAMMKLSSSLSQLPELRQFIAQLCVKVPGDRESITQKLQLAVNEAFCNISKHGYGEVLGQIVISVERLQEGMIIELADQSQGFDPLTVPPPNLTGEKDGGYGVHIVKSIADDLSYHKSTVIGGWNRLRIYKKYETRMDTMDLKHKKEDGVLVVTIDAANLDAKEAPDFKKRLIEIVDEENCPYLVVDIGSLQFIDSSGLGSLLSVLRHLNSRQGDLKIANMTPPVRAMFEIVRMHKLFEIYPSSKEAVRSFQQEGLRQN